VPLGHNFAKHSTPDT